MFQIFTAAECAALRAPGWLSFQGWPLQDTVSTGRARCRSCGKTIAKGETAGAVYLDLSVPIANAAWDGNGWKATRIWLHQNCDAAH